MAKDAIVKFQKSATSEEKQKIIDDIKSAGGTIVRDDNVGSSIFPFVVVNVSPDQFASLKSGLAGSKVVSHIEEDQEMTTQ
ncbi:hypothetical protein CcaverHIS002_0410930 [Cutaneotrichosporon cavernicola]|uniref:Inhibitor I9 domain-containing protein n=1 Tax=Cutaneotrichosporon cavernicola TaxID=279322 RepID=A0AA48L5F8_9TREE|nr:uncharacterized protein CcaverHIS019_0410830 [Cutaneotrichosporon cavernicola]BEI84489.1 hypothetical protein CcaverHIS002_0410930 [Cutaneotrichosporon cavernicola]BEI92263.1 hypothetical protein CcaverHIS019_0410830 [Cutaneotrichosporon cavernicola]BEJ00035.1 hypothetical protein CcaverHIS631_0410770 [Cutaneotrichosporon cavernicola]BEJ07807.1 hypothetical protein CcaverHIS641_0410760 [Cutaneotrichosporon cavernicola]